MPAEREEARGISLFIGNFLFSKHLQLIWDYDGSILKPGEIIEFTFILTVDKSGSSLRYFAFNDPVDFNFEIYISPSEHISDII